VNLPPVIARYSNKYCSSTSSMEDRSEEPNPMIFLYKANNHNSTLLHHRKRLFYHNSFK